MRKIILASQSPRRKKLLEQIGLPVRIGKINVHEMLNPRLKPVKQAEELSKLKSQVAVKKYKNALVITADTIVAMDNEVIGKPRSMQDAQRILRKLGGKKHQVITAYTVADTKSGKSITRSVLTQVYVKRLTEDEIKNYVATGEPMDKAGAYGIQELGSVFIERIEGDYFTIVGLPLFDLSQTLKKFDVTVLG